MKKLTIQQKQYAQSNEFYQLILPLDLEMLIPEDDSVRLLSEVLEGLDYSKLYKEYSRKGRKPSIEPKILFKVLVYARSNNIYSSRKIENACKRDINFMWLLKGAKAPDHSTIARFQKEYLADAIEDLFYQLVKYLHNIGEIEFENLFVDGTKIEANANRYTFVWKKVVNKNEAKMFIKVQSCIEELNLVYNTNFAVAKESVVSDISKALDFVKEKIKQENIELVSGIGKRNPLC